MRRTQLGLKASSLMLIALLAAACGGTDAATDSGTEPAATGAATTEEDASPGGGETEAGPAEDLTFVLAASVLAPKEEVATFAVPQELGYFDEENVSVEIQNADGSTAAIQAVASGSGDITAADLGSVYAAADKGVPVVALGGLVINWPWRIGVPADSDIASCEDLDGTSVGVISLSSGSAPFTRSFLESCGLEADTDVQLVPVGVGPQAAAALSSGEVDSLALYTQAYTTLEQSGTELSYLDNPESFDPLTSLVWTTSRDVLENKPDAIADFLRAAYKGLTYSVANTEAAMQLGYEAIPQLLSDQDAEERLEGDTALLATWLETASLPGEPATWTDFGYLNEEQLQATMDYAIAAGTVEGELDPTTVYEESVLEVANDWDAAEVAAEAESAG